MKITIPTAWMAAAATLLVAGCSNIERSRDLGNPEVSGATLAQQVCSGCHGLGGRSVSPNFPNLAAQTAPYLSAQMREFRSHGRSDQAGVESMWGLSRSLTDAQIDGLAAYFSAQQPAAPIPPDGVTAARLDAGRAIFQAGLPAQGVPPCAACHGASAQGQATFPRLSGQHADYLVKQLHVLKDTKERPDAAAMMPVAHALTPQNVADVTAYLQSGPAP